VGVAEELPASGHGVGGGRSEFFVSCMECVGLLVQLSSTLFARTPSYSLALTHHQQRRAQDSH
jgi:hypothetical protein